MAIVARRNLGRMVRLAQHHGLAVVGLAIMFQPVRMTFATALVAERLEIIARRVADLVRAVAIDTHRPALVALRQQLAVNALVINLLDAHVTFAAGLRHVRVVDGRITINVTLDFMRTMTIVARRRHDQPHLQQRVAMNAVHVLRGRLRELDLVFLGEIGVAVALRTRHRQVQFVHG